MGIKNTSGFTIIEVMLFLGVTGVLTAALLVGSGVSIGQQRYRDSVNSLKSLIQEQYSDVTNVANGRGDDVACNTNAVVTVPPQTVINPKARGASDCMLVGRILTIAADGATVATQDVIGARTSETAPVAPTDIIEMRTNYHFGLSSIDKATTQVAWSAHVVNPTAVNGPFKGLTVLIVRSPVTGSIMTFVARTVVTNAVTLKGLIDSDSPVTQNTDVCVNADRTSFVGQPLAVRVDAYAADQSGVEIPTESEGVCG